VVVNGVTVGTTNTGVIKDKEVVTSTQEYNVGPKGLLDFDATKLTGIVKAAGFGTGVKLQVVRLSATHVAVSAVPRGALSNDYKAPIFGGSVAVTLKKAGLVEKLTINTYSQPAVLPQTVVITITLTKVAKVL
jgi:hypothetical protein